MDEKESLTTNTSEWMDKFGALFTEIISRKYTLLEIFLLWFLFTVFHAFYTMVGSRLALLLFESLGYQPVMVFP
jgi:hypothetical protein